ncbi:MAG: TetR family transcriptional regulator [Phenylobacterium sp.]|uniref:TetR family transcriptional regulator n=1 Tax=Phenylobacterium sp. TaxID=1871053 RepID=UPI0025E7031F|nr:TetR family transcriptional regulator [Phenylobacterium sp.]MBI1199781.1 TetR family transcriptional regulator [Phenylobacterium sp.]
MNDRLTASDWIDHGLRTLAAHGPGALRVGPMATGLNVSRGSFYWHFRDIADFRARLLEAWEARATEAVIRDVEARASEPDRLRDLLARAFTARPRLDAAVRAWAAEDAAVATAVTAVDARRIAYIARLLRETGVEACRAQARATFLYWAFLGQGAVIDPAHGALQGAAIDEIGGLFER